MPPKGKGKVTEDKVGCAVVLHRRRGNLLAYFPDFWNEEQE